MGLWRRKEIAKAATASYYIRAAGTGRKIPKGYVPMVLVGEKESGDQRVLVHVRMLKEPCMEALLEMAAQQFGYDQQGVLRVPCTTPWFKQIINVACKAK